MGAVEPGAILLFGALLIGLCFGAVARLSGFCLRSAVLELLENRASHQSIAWCAALFAAIGGTQTLVLLGVIDLSETIYLAGTTALPVITIGGILFGSGMMLTRGCGGRHLVLAAGGNLRSWIVLLVLGLSAYITMRGLLAEPRVWLEGVAAHSFAVGSAGLPAVASAEIGIPLLSSHLSFLLVIIAVLAFLGWKVSHFVGGRAFASVLTGLIVGGLVPAAWYISGVVAFDEFDPTAPVGLTYTSPVANSLQYLMTYTGASADFGIAVVGGTLFGAVAIVGLRRDFRLEAFETPAQLLRYMAGAAMMGIGGVMTLGCSIGAGLTGVSTLSLVSVISFVSILFGAVCTHVLQIRRENRAHLAPAE